MDNLARRQLVIPALEQPEGIRLRVAAYCRVSTDSADQKNSFSAQNTYYSALISGNENWELVDIYADATVIMGLKQNPTIGRRFSPFFHLSGTYRANMVGATPK